MANEKISVQVLALGHDKRSLQSTNIPATKSLSTIAFEGFLFCVSSLVSLNMFQSSETFIAVATRQGFWFLSRQ